MRAPASAGSRGGMKHCVHLGMPKPSELPERQDSRKDRRSSASPECVRRHTVVVAKSGVGPSPCPRCSSSRQVSSATWSTRPRTHIDLTCQAEMSRRLVAANRVRPAEVCRMPNRSTAYRRSRSRSRSRSRPPGPARRCTSPRASGACSSSSPATGGGSSAGSSCFAQSVPGYARESNHLRVHGNHLRRTLEADPSRPRHILTEPAIGYRLAG
jgi:hypothetical protein